MQVHRLRIEGDEILDQGKGRRGTPIPAPRPFSLGAASGRSPTRSSADETATEHRARSVVRLPSGPEPIPAMAGAPAAAPVQGLGLMSGRGLY